MHRVVAGLVAVVAVMAAVGVWALSDPDPPEGGAAADAGPSGREARRQEAALDSGSPSDPAPEPEPEPEPDPVLRRSELTVVAPLTSGIVEHLKEIVAAAGDTRQANLFAKVGGSTTVNRGFLHCFDTEHVDLGGRVELEESLAFFKAGRAMHTSPFGRESESAGVGWTTIFLNLGRPPNFLREIMLIRPRYALMLVVGNDVNGHDEAGFGSRLLAMIEAVVDLHVIPILGSAVPRGDEAADAWAIRHGRMTRAVAHAMRLPFVDYHLALRDLPDKGLGSDGMHPDVHVRGGPRGCVLTEEGLTHGNNARNLHTLVMLDRLHRTLDLGEEPAAAAEPLRGTGTEEDPYRVAAIPFGHRATGPASYRLVLAEPMRLRASVSRLGEAQVTVQLGEGRPGHSASVELEPGTHTLRVEAEPGVGYVVGLFEDPRDPPPRRYP